MTKTFYCNHSLTLDVYTVCLENELEYLPTPEDFATTRGCVIVENQKGQSLTFDFDLFMWITENRLCYECDTDNCIVTDELGDAVSRKYIEIFFDTLPEGDDQTLQNFESYVFNGLINDLMNKCDNEFKKFILEKQLESNE